MGNKATKLEKLGYQWPSQSVRPLVLQKKEKKSRLKTRKCSFAGRMGGGGICFIVELK